MHAAACMGTVVLEAGMVRDVDRAARGVALAGHPVAGGIEHLQAAKRRHLGHAHRDEAIQPAHLVRRHRVRLDPLTHPGHGHVGDVHDVVRVLGQGAGEVRGLDLVGGDRGGARLPGPPAVQPDQQQAHRQHGGDDADMQRDAAARKEGQSHGVRASRILWGTTRPGMP